MTKTKIIYSTKPEELELEINKWLEENQNVKIINISHSFSESLIPMSGVNFKERVFSFIALIVYDEKFVAYDQESL